VEFQIPGINQVPVKKEIGLTFAATLRSILRPDPDIIMIGEIRDTETAEIAVEAALTGHQVLSTLHCNDAPGAISRLDDMEVAPFLISSSVILSCAQRLMRRICPACKEPVSYPEKMFVDLGIDPKTFDMSNLHRGRGCDRCKNSGYSGRLAIIEAMSMSDEIRKLIIKRASAQEIGKIAISQGMKTLRLVGLQKAQEGLSTLEQVMLVTSSSA
jgi:type IV pilus assembly protein PilB